MDTIHRNTNWPDVEKFVPMHSETYPFISPSGADLCGRSVCIFGASRGIGRTTAIRFAVAGASMIAIAARSPLEEVENAIHAAASAAGRPRPRVLCPPGTDIVIDASVEAAAKAYVQRESDHKLCHFQRLPRRYQVLVSQDHILSHETSI